MNNEESLPFEANSYSVDPGALEARKAALLTMFTGIGAILSLMLTCFLGSYYEQGSRAEIAIIFMLMLVIVSVILYFIPSKKDERWYLVCSLLNHGGIGLAVLTLTDILVIDIRFLHLAVGVLPAAAILFGVAMILICQNGESGDAWLYAGIIVLLGMCGIALYRFFNLEQTEFWLCMAVCALLSAVNLGVLVWVRRDVWYHSVYRGLAVASFGVYLLLLVAAIIAFFVMADSGSSNRKSKRDSKSSSGRRNSRLAGLLTGKSGDNRTSASRGFGDGGAAADGVRPSAFYTPGRMRYFSPRFYVYNTRRASDENAAWTNPDSRSARIRRAIVTLIILVIVVLLILLAIKAGRG